MTIPFESLSQDMQVMLTVYRLNKSQQHATFRDVAKHLEETIGQNKLRSIFEKLLDLGLITGQYEKLTYPEGWIWTRVFQVSSDAIPTVQKLERSYTVRNPSLDWHQIQFHTIPPEAFRWELWFFSKDGNSNFHPHTGDMSMVQDIDINYQPKCHGSVPYCNDSLMPVPKAVCFESCQNCPYRKNISQ